MKKVIYDSTPDWTGYKYIYYYSGILTIKIPATDYYQEAILHENIYISGGSEYL
jgi:hypothetical protein